MTLELTALAMRRMASAFQRRPEAAVQEDAPATAVWAGGTRVTTGHANGARITTDMPAAMAGSDQEVTPGWLFRAGLASCTATSVALEAAARGITPGRIEVTAGSRSDARGVLGMTGADGAPVYAGPGDVRLRVRVAASGVAPQQLRDLVEKALRCSPIPSLVSTSTPMAVHIEVEAG